MPEALRALVAVVVAEVLGPLRPVVPGQFKEALTVAGAFPSRYALPAWVAEEVERETSSRTSASSHESHAHDILIELERLLGILDSNHCMILLLG